MTPNAETFDVAKCKCPLKMPVFAGVPDTVWEGFCKKRITNDYHKGNIIFYEGNKPFGVYFLCTGRVKIIRTDAGLHSSIPRVIEAPNLLGERAFLAGSYLGTGGRWRLPHLFVDGAYFETFLSSPGLPLLVRRLAAELGHAENSSGLRL